MNGSRPRGEDTPKLKRSELKLRERFSALERDWLIGCLVSKGGVREVIYGDEDPHRLTVEYDAGLMNSVDLVDFLHLWGLVAEAVPAFMPNNVTDR